MIFSMIFLLFIFTDPDLPEILTNLADTPKVVDSAGFMGFAFFNSRGPLTLGGTRATLSVKGSGDQDC